MLYKNVTTCTGPLHLLNSTVLNGREQCSSSFLGFKHGISGVRYSHHLTRYIYTSVNKTISAGFESQKMGKTARGWSYHYSIFTLVNIPKD